MVNADKLAEIPTWNPEKVIQSIDALVGEIPLDSRPEPVNQIPDIRYFPESPSPKKCEL